jgi:hypothetical protein
MAPKEHEGRIKQGNSAPAYSARRDLKGKLFGDRGYISRELFERLYER